MKKILFVCHGNICRSPMAMYVLRDLVEKRGIADQFYIDSAATSTEEIGNTIYPPARRKLEHEGVAIDGHRARQLRRDDYTAYDLLLGADSANIRNMNRICGGDPERKIHRMLEYAGRGREEVADPWYTGDFDATWVDIFESCTALLKEL